MTHPPPKVSDHMSRDQYPHDIPLQQQVDVLRDMTAAEERRLDRTIDELPALVKQAVLEALKEVPQMSEEEHAYLKIATKAAAQRYKLRQAVIEKTLAGLIWAGIAAAGMIAWQVIVKFIQNPSAWIKP